MPKNSIANIIIAWEKVLMNAKDNAMDVPGMDAYLPPLEEILAEAKALSARLDLRVAVKQQEGLDRRNLIRKGNLQASRIRSAVKAYYGRDSERVIEFGARPVRPRTGKTRQEPTPVPAPASPPPAAAAAGAAAAQEGPGLSAQKGGERGSL